MGPIRLFLSHLYILQTIAYAKVDLNNLENEQELLIQNLNKSKADALDLKEKLDFLKPTRSNESLSITNSVASNDSKKDSNVDVKVHYTAPIIILLPEDVTFRDKWEYAVTLKCLGQKDFSAFDQVHNSRMAEMMSIKGKTADEIQDEIKTTKTELESTSREYETQKKKVESIIAKTDKERTHLLHQRHALKLLKRQVDLLTTKLHRLEKRLKSAILFSKGKTPKGQESEKGHGETEDEQENYKDEQENYEDEENDEGEQENYE
ncbi:hypothetical protein BdWA1_001072 [Babesia duncani]|uniref:Uncharacterized protein n=1 Tax=Babesia duncani TaxID=323732 RepID=A0AAD9PNG7_9APIC|nr:hypothetical protein BdWA1_001072 [Babesia duncani]